MRTISAKKFRQAVEFAVKLLGERWKAKVVRLRMPPEGEAIVRDYNDYERETRRFARIPVDFSNVARPAVAYVYGMTLEKREIIYEIDLTDGALRRIPRR